MSHAKFASITAKLLARKGEAAPWQERGQDTPPWRSDIPYALADLPPLVSARPERSVPRPFARTPAKKAITRAHASPDKIKKIALRMSQHDYERLGLIAVKKETTRQHLLQEALERVLAVEAEQYQKDCACLGLQKCEAACSG